MRDPFNFPRPAMFPMAAPCRLTTRSSGAATPDHMHRAYPDQLGNGATDHTASHTHFIYGWQVQPCPADGHTHILTKIPCGAGRA